MKDVTLSELQFNRIYIISSLKLKGAFQKNLSNLGNSNIFGSLIPLRSNEGFIECEIQYDNKRPYIVYLLEDTECRVHGSFDPIGDKEKVDKEYNDFDVK